MIDWEQEIEKWESQIRDGQLSEVKKTLRHLNTPQIPRKHKLKVAHLAYRTNLPATALRILGPHIKGTKEINEPATHLEIAEYAISLSRLGATKEASELLGSIPNKNHPQILLYEAFIAITQWDYQKAIDPLKKYIDHPEINDYQRLIAQTNLAASFVFLEKWSEASSLLKEVLKTSQNNQHQLLFGNALELSAQAALFQKEYRQATQFLDQASGILSYSAGSSKLYIEKWRTILALSKKSNPLSLAKLTKIKEASQKKQLWENVRDCDYFLGLFSNDLELIRKIFYGTPHQSYRQKLLKAFPGEIDLETPYIWNLGSKTQKTFCLQNGKIIFPEEIKIKAGQKLHQLLHTLSMDFYRPFRMGTLFSYLFPNENFDPFSSPDRVYQLIRRLRIWAQENEFPLLVLKGGNGYSIDPSSPVAFQKTLNPELQQPFEYRLLEIKNKWPNEAFRLKDVEKLLGVSRTQAFYIVGSVLGEKIEKVGSGPQTKYKFTA